MARQEFKGAAESLTLQANINNSVTSLASSATPSANWPTATSFSFVIVVGRGTASEEKMLVGARSTSTFSSITRGYDGTSAVSHTAGETVEHCVAATVIDEANAHVNDTTRNDHTQYPLKSIGTTKGDLWVFTGAGVLVRQPVGSDDQFLLAASGQTNGVKYGAIPSGAISSSAMFGSGVVGASALAASTREEFITFTKTGTLATGTGTIPFRVPVAMTIQHVRLACGTAPTGAAILVDVNKGGTTIFTTQANRPTIATSATSETATTAPDVTSLAAGDKLTVDIDQIGSSVTGSDLTITVYCKV